MKNRLPTYIFKLLLAAYFLALLRLIVFKGTLSFLASHIHYYGWHVIRQGYALANFIPGKTLYYYLSLQEKIETGLQNIGGNILLFMPFGLLLPLVFRRLRGMGALLLAALLTSLSFELMQLLLAIGTFDVDDLLLNVLGAWLGFHVFRYLAALYIKRRSAKLRAAS